MTNLSDDEQLAKAIRIAAKCHEEQHDKNGAPYVLHPLRMLQRAIAGGQPRSVQIVAVLHDVVEDSEEYKPTSAGLEKLKNQHFSHEICQALEHVTKREAEEKDYDQFVNRICQAEGVSGRIARRVKLLDLEDNMDILRYGNLTEKTFKRLQRYHDARKKVLAAIELRDC